EATGSTSATAAARVLDTLEHADAVDTSRVAAWGIGRGATITADIAARRSELKAIVLQSGVYDPGIAGRIKAHVLVIHGEQDPEAPAAQAHAFVTAIQQAGGVVESRFTATLNQATPLDPRPGVEFLRHTFKR